MSTRRAADRYARALLDVSVNEADPRIVGSELEEFVQLTLDHPGLSHAFTNPAVPVGRKRALVTELLDKVTVTPVLGKLLLFMAGRDRLALLPELLEAFRRRLMDHLNIARAEVTTAVPLTADREEALERSLSAITGRRVTLNLEVDPSIVGGVMARVGSVVYDGSVRRQLERIRERLVEGV
jgi:F-type H+-transporting ATPase subunit delta